MKFAYMYSRLRRLSSFDFLRGAALDLHVINTDKPQSETTVQVNVGDKYLPDTNFYKPIPCTEPGISVLFSEKPVKQTTEV